MDSYLIFLCEWWRLFTDVVIKNGSFHALGNYSHLLAADAIDNWWCALRHIYQFASPHIQAQDRWRLRPHNTFCSGLHQYGRLHQALHDSFKWRWQSAFHDHFTIFLHKQEVYTFYSAWLREYLWKHADSPRHFLCPLASTAQVIRWSHWSLRDQGVCQVYPRSIQEVGTR